MLVNQCITLFYSIQVNMSAPKARNVNAIAIWMFGCCGMVFAGLCELGIILLIKLRKGIPLEKLKHLENLYSINSKENTNQTDGMSMNGTLLTLKNIDCISLILFPTVFGIFIIIYFLSFL